MKRLLFIALLFSLFACDNDTCFQYTMKEPMGVITSISSDRYGTIAVIQYTTTAKSGGGYAPSFPIKKSLKMLVPNVYQVGDTIRLINSRLE